MATVHAMRVQLRMLVQRANDTSTFSGRVLWTLAGNVALAIIGLGTGVILSRALGVDGRGQYAAVQSWVLLLTVLGEFGLPEATVYVLGKKNVQYSLVLMNAIVIAVPALILSVVIGYIAMPLLLDAQSMDTITLARFFLLYTFVQFTNSLSLQVIRATGQWRAWNLLRIGNQLGWLIVLLTLLLSSVDVSARVVIIMFLLWSLVAASIALTRAISTIRMSFSIVPNVLKTLWRYALPSFATAIPKSINARLDIALVAALLGPYSVGLYAAAIAWSASPLFITQLFAPVVFPHLRDIEDQVERQKFVRKRLPQMVLVVLGASCLTAISSVVAIPLIFGSDFRGAVVAGMLLSLAAGLTGLNATLESVVQGFGFPWSGAIAQLTAVLISPVLLFALISETGITGACIGAIAIQVVVAGMLFRQLTTRMQSSTVGRPQS